MENSLSSALEGNAKFLGMLQDDSFARAAFDVLCDKEFVNKQGKRWSCSNRFAAKLISGLRGETEDPYRYCHEERPDRVQNDPNVTAFRNILDHLGWHELTPEEDAEQVLDAIHELEIAETLPASGTPEWYAALYGFVARIGQPETLVQRIHKAAQDGRISKHEFHDLLARALPSPEAIEIVEARLRARQMGMA